MEKKCNCGITHTVIPSEARLQVENDIGDGVCWECRCGSTMFLPLERLQSCGILDTLNVMKLIENNRQYKARFEEMLSIARKL